MEGVNINFVKVRQLAMSVVDPVHVSYVVFASGSLSLGSQFEVFYQDNGELSL